MTACASVPTRSNGQMRCAPLDRVGGEVGDGDRPDLTVFGQQAQRVRVALADHSAPICPIPIAPLIDWPARASIGS